MPSFNEMMVKMHQEDMADQRWMDDQLAARGLQTHAMASGALAGTAMNSASLPWDLVKARAPMPALTPADIQHAATEGRNTERDRILARLNAIKPGECSYTRLQSEWERKGAMRLWERMRDAIVDGKEAHKDRDALEGGE